VSDRRLRPREDVVAEGTCDAPLLVDVATQEIYDLNETAWRIWECVAEGLSEAEIVNRLAEEYDASVEELRDAVAETVVELLELGLVVD
jgi:hypothetical protein